MHAPAWRTLASTTLALAATHGVAAGAPIQNLLTNPSFENGLTGWTVKSGTVIVESYGAAGVAGTDVATHIGGGQKLLRHTGDATASVEQVVTVGALPTGTNVRVGGFFGGYLNAGDRGRPVVRFLDAGGSELGLRDLDHVTAVNRNFETVLMIRTEILPIDDPATTAIALCIEFENACCGDWYATADGFSLELTTDSPIPPPHALDAEILINPDFESGWGSGSPLTLVDPQGWEGCCGSTGVLVEPYSNVDSTVPDLVVSTIISGDANLLTQVVEDGAIHQLIDVRGDDFGAGALALRVSGYFGGIGDFTDRARLDVCFLDASWNKTGPQPPPVGDVTRDKRNSEDVLMFQELQWVVPPSTVYIDVTAYLDNECCGDTYGFLDNLSAQLVIASAPPPLPLDLDVVHNGGFESGDLSDSPLELNDPHTWCGTNDETVTVPAYGSSAVVPPVSFAIANGLGGLLVRDGSENACLLQRFDLSAHSSAIDAGDYFVHLEAWLGGYENEEDTAEVRLKFKKVGGAQVGTLQILPPVTATERGGVTTLLRRSIDVQIPPKAIEMELTLEFTNFCCGDSYGLADGIRLVVYDAVIGTRYCDPAVVNSTGLPAAVGAFGSAETDANFVTLTATDLPPNQFGYFVTSTTQGFIAAPGGSQGNLCLAGQVGRYNRPGEVLNSGAFGSFSLALDLGNTPQPTGTVAIQPGETWNFTTWYRDVNPTPTSNFTDAVSVLFQ